MSAEKINKLIRMLDDVDYRKRAIRKLEILGRDAKSAVPALWEISKDTDGNPDEEIRVAALKALTSIEGGTAEMIRRLLVRLDKDKEPYVAVRVQAAQSLMGLDSSDLGVMSRLEELLKGEIDPVVRQAIVRTMIALGDQGKLFELALGTLENSWQGSSALHPLDALMILIEIELSDAQRDQTLESLWGYMRKYDQFIWFVFDAILEITTDDPEVLEQLVNDEAITITNQSIVITHRNLYEHITDQFNKSREPILTILLEAVRSGDEEEAALTLLRNILDESPVNDTLLDGVESIMKENGRGLKLMFYFRPEVVKQWIDEGQPDEFKAKIGHFLLEDARNLLDERWDGDDQNKETLLEYVLAVVKSEKKVEDTFGYLDWLREVILDVPPGSVDGVVQALSELKFKAVNSDSPVWFDSYIDSTLNPYEKRSNALKAKHLLKEIGEGKAEGDELIKKIKDVASIGSAEGVRVLVDAWVHWVIFNEQPSIVDSTAEALRYSYLAVLPFVDQLTKDVPLVHQVLTDLLENSPYTAELLITVMKGERIPAEDELVLQEWVKTYQQRSDAFAELVQNAKDQSWSLKKQVEEIVQLLEREKQFERRLEKDRRVTHQLADMSDERFFGEQRVKEYEAIRKELRAHAIPVLSRMLPGATDTDIRENLARTLGNLGGREAVDALVRAVVEEEKKRNARQELLATYYLEPSKKQSEEAATILSGAVQDAKKTLRLLQGLNIAVFAAGMILLLAGTLTSLFSNELGSRLLGALAGLGGLVGVIVQLINTPLDRIQNAMANLVQIETAFTSFIWELNLNGTYIQSQYVAEGILTNDEITQTVNRIENAMSLAMNLVAVYTEEGRQRIVTRINSLSPAAGPSASQITIHGQHLQGDSTEKKVQEGIIAINHVPIHPTNLSWKEEAVRFTLPTAVPNLEDGAGTIWLSLLIDGMETNALPFHVIERDE